MSESEAPAGINPDLIERYMRAGDLPNLLSIFDFQRRQMTRAEDLSRAYLAQMVEMGKNLSVSTRVSARASESESATPRPPTKKPGAAPSMKAPSTPSAMDINLDDL